ncbi:MAG TPA: efflux RND transporter periplasmic adaptor subunit [Desulfitobacteriaceae bacterium]|nr:efflux RND transporter periplasmic adaptor subunit [Desulfitobacteriaceae bacterium]
MKISKNKWIILGILGVMVLAGGVWAYKYFSTPTAITTNITAQAKLADVQKVITATGTANFLDPVPLYFQANGKIIVLNIEAGDKVTKGQVLAQLDTTKLKQTVEQCQVALLQSQVKLEQLYDDYSNLTLKQAQSQLEKAKVQLTSAQQNADPDYLANQVYLAEQKVLNCSDTLAKAQLSGLTASIQSAQAALNQAQSELTAVQNLQNRGAAQALMAAQTDVDAAQNAVSLQIQGPKTTDLQLAQANISQAQTALDSANKDLTEATLVAPIDGIIVKVSAQENQNITTESVIMTMAAGQDQLQIDTSVDQADITQIKVGQKADITLDSAPDEHISGTISQIAPIGTIVNNVTTFSVTILLDNPSSLLYASMSTNVSIILEEAKNVLTVPSEAVKTMGNHKVVMVPGAAGAAVQPVTVVTGLDDGTKIEIKNGLSEGQEVIISTGSTTAASSSSSGSSSLRNNGSGMGALRGITSGGGSPRD